MRRVNWLVSVSWLVSGIAAVILLAIGVSIGRSCYKGPTKVEQRVDKTLETVPAWRDTVLARDSALAARAKESKVLRHNLAIAQDSAAVRLVRADSMLAAANSASSIPDGVSPHDSITHLAAALNAQKRVTAELRLGVIAALQLVNQKQATLLAKADTTIGDQLAALKQADRRIDRLTTDLNGLRNQTKHSGKVLGFLPSWTGKVLLATGCVYVGYKVGRAAS